MVPLSSDPVLTLRRFGSGPSPETNSTPELASVGNELGNMAPGSCSGVSLVSLAPVALAIAGSDLDGISEVSVSAACEAGDLPATMEPATMAIGARCQWVRCPPGGAGS